MAKKKSTPSNKELNAEELSQYVPENDIPKLQAAIGLGLDSTFNLAQQSGASVIGKKNDHTQVIPALKVK